MKEQHMGSNLDDFLESEPIATGNSAHPPAPRPLSILSSSSSSPTEVSMAFTNGPPVRLERVSICRSLRCR